MDTQWTIRLSAKLSIRANHALFRWRMALVAATTSCAATCFTAVQPPTRTVRATRAAAPTVSSSRTADTPRVQTLRHGRRTSTTAITTTAQANRTALGRWLPHGNARHRTLQNIPLAAANVSTTEVTNDKGEQSIVSEPAALKVSNVVLVGCSCITPLLLLLLLSLMLLLLQIRASEQCSYTCYEFFLKHCGIWPSSCCCWGR